MKKYFLTLILMAAIILNAQFAFAANEVVEDYLDIATSYADSGNYASAMDYLNKILSIEPSNKEVAGLKNSLMQMQSGKIVSPVVKNDVKLSQAQSAKTSGNKAVETAVLLKSRTRND